MMEMEVMHSGQQDMDLIDILWRQDIDLGARREVFDYSHRQKEHELQRQQELAEEKRLHLLREQEKALLAQLQLDEETGEYVPRPLPSTPLQSAYHAAVAPTPLAVAQDVSFTQQGAGTLSFDECLQLLAETFPIEENEDASVSLDTSDVSVESSRSSSVAMMSPEQPSLAPLTLSPGPMIASQPQKIPLDIEQAWMELLSLPELQHCLSLQMEDTLETTTYPLPNSTEAQDPNYSFYPMSSPVEEKNNLNVCPTVFMNTFDSSVPSVTPADNVNRMKSEVPQLNTHFNLNSFCNTFYPDTSLEESSSQQDLEGKEYNIMSDVQKLYSLSPGDTFERGRHNASAEVPDLDSGLSSSPDTCSPGKSLYGDEGFDGSDSDMEEMDQNPGSTKSDYSEMFSLNFQPDDVQQAFPLPTLADQVQIQQDEPKKEMDPAEDNGQSSSPFTKDKRKRRSDLRHSRDEQKAKALKIPFSVDMIINVPVDDYNELISKNQLNEAQLALVRDIRRRGKNKVAAQNCRKRKMENIVGLELDLDSLKEEKERLLGEKSRNVNSLREMKRKLNSLYLEVFSMLRDEDGNSISPTDFSLQQSTEGSVFLVPRTKKTLIKS
ncbi:LOW QUALITY PROTEIN: nuclear factor erythroid 2-related factor 2a [Phycodurus eques]|uniref:LOW QUALITY PROTEIN: nuclear factor erythroid 2-related factor 2a n=1 Tax=Phycodurus eques TaxID=693459 RepID=UPI002ACEC857|nr:LOW QUALITY PROTEIN: nuclear factor erythroid 2-related factor 2a [Phycodurus eques]